MSSPVLGAGLAPAGLAAAGFGSPATATDPGSALLPDGKGGTGTCRLINPLTGDYVADANGNLMGMTSAAQLVLLALATVPVGNRTISDRDIASLKADTQAALAPLVKRGIITVRSIDVARVDGAATRLLRTVSWVDTITSAAQTTVV